MVCCLFHSDTMNYIDLFAGAGGLSEGFYNARFHPVAHVEMNREACNTLRTRLAWYYLHDHQTREPYNAYLRQRITRKELYALVPPHLLKSVINKPIGEDTREEIFKQIDEQLARLPADDRQVDLIIGGPPCQTFSVAGRARLGAAAMEEDPRSRLYLQYAKFLEKCQPRMFIFENVLGMLSFRQSQQLDLIRAAFDAVGYEMDVREWNAREFGVLQSRERLVIVGWRKEGPEKLGYPNFYILNEQRAASSIRWPRCSPTCRPSPLPKKATRAGRVGRTRFLITPSGWSAARKPITLSIRACVSAARC